MKKAFVKTENYARFAAGVKAVEQRGAAEAGMMLVYGQPGYGKSHIVYRWAEEAGAVYLRANVDWTPKYFLVELCKALNIDGRGTAQKYPSSTTVTLEPGTSAFFSVWVKTMDMTYNGTSEEKGPKVDGERGAYIGVTHTVGGTTLDPMQIKNIDTEKQQPHRAGGGVRPLHGVGRSAGLQAAVRLPALTRHDGRGAAPVRRTHARSAEHPGQYRAHCRHQRPFRPAGRAAVRGRGADP